MCFGAHYHGYGWRAEQAIRFDIPTGLLQNGVTRGRQSGEVGDGGPGHEGPGGSSRQPQHVEQPAQRNLFENGPNGAGREQAGALVPGAGKKIGGERGRQRAAQDESEESATGIGDRRRRPTLSRISRTASGLVGCSGKG